MVHGRKTVMNPLEIDFPHDRRGVSFPFTTSPPPFLIVLCNFFCLDINKYTTFPTRVLRHVSVLHYLDKGSVIIIIIFPEVEGTVLRRLDLLK